MSAGTGVAALTGMAGPSIAGAARVRPGTFNPATVHRTVLANGLTVIVRPNKSAPVVAIVTYVKAGYFDETDDVVGIAHVLEHMFFKGTASRGVGEIARQTKASGGYLNASTIYDHTRYYAVLPSSGFQAGLEIQADAYANSAIDGAELARELEVIIQEARRKEDNPSAVAVETLYELLHDRHRIRHWRIGREQGLRALTRDHVLGFYRNFYRPRSTILCIAGDVAVDEAMREVERHYGALPDGEVARTPGPAEPGHTGARYRELSGDVTQSQLVMGWRTPDAAHPDTPLLDLAAVVLGAGRASRLYRAVRERKLVSSISAGNYTPTELGVFTIHAEAPPATALDAARGVWDQMRQAVAAGFAADELERARRIFEARWIRRLETMEGQANHLADWEAMGGWALGDEYLERVLLAGSDDVAAAVRRHLDPGAAGMVLYRPQASPPMATGAAEMRALLEQGAPPPLRSIPAVAAAPARPAPRAPDLERVEAGVRVYRTAAGVPILVRRKPHAPMTHLGLFVTGGVRDEGATRAGLTSLTARTAVKGTGRRTAEQLAAAAETLGGSVSPSVGGESFGWTISVPGHHAAAATELLADVVQHPSFPADALDTERALVLADLALLRDDMYRYPMRLLVEAAYPDHPYGAPVLGTERTVPALTVEDVRGWHRERVLAGQTVVAVVGDDDPDRLARLLAAEFDALSSGTAVAIAPPAWPTATKARAEVRDKAQTALAIAYPSPGRLDEERFAAHLLAGVASGLGGRFFDELRDRQSLAYTVHAFPSERPLGGLFAAYIATSPDKEEVARRGLLAEFAKLRESPVTADELARAQAYAIGTYAIRQESGGAVLADVVDAWMFGAGLSELDEHDARVRAVTPAAILALARRWFDESRRVEAVVRGAAGERVGAPSAAGGGAVP